MDRDTASFQLGGVFRLLILIAAGFWLSACAGVSVAHAADMDPAKAATSGKRSSYDHIGLASWYGKTFHGKKTSSGEKFDGDGLTAAHMSLPLQSVVEVTNLDNGRTVRVRVNDRGSFPQGRILDVSHAAAEALGFIEKGVAHVRVRYLGQAKPGQPLDQIKGPGTELAAAEH